MRFGSSLSDAFSAFLPLHQHLPRVGYGPFFGRIKALPCVVPLEC
jgi:hypothetical protein